MDPSGYFERWFQSYCESKRSDWLKGSVENFRMAAYEAFNEGIHFERNQKDEDDLADV